MKKALVFLLSVVLTLGSFAGWAIAEEQEPYYIGMYLSQTGTSAGVGDNQLKGAQLAVTEINENGSAAKSGLEVGDILQKINGTEISSFATLSQMLTKYGIGDTVTLTIRRPTIELTNNNLSEYLNSCEEIDIEITFVEFNPNA